MSQSATQQVADALREMIFSGHLAPGSDHLEAELASKLGTSRTPVREAALTLQAQGLVSVRPRRGIRVLPLSANDMREVYAVLTELEALSAEAAARAGHDSVALEGMSAAIDEMDAALTASDREAWAVADTQFHDALVGLGGNSRVQTIVEMMNDQVRRARAVTLNLRPLLHASNADHRAVLKAIEAGDADKARQLHHEHRRRTGEELVRLLEKYKLSNL